MTKHPPAENGQTRRPRADDVASRYHHGCRRRDRGAGRLCEQTPTKASSLMKHLFDLSGRVALVAGGGGYLGRPICEALAAHGAAVVVGDVKADAAQAAADVVQHQGGAAMARSLDVSDEAAIRGVLDDAERELGPVDVLVNCTTYATGRGLEDLSLDDWQACMRVTLGGAFLLSREAGVRMSERGGGSIVHFSSMYGVVSPDPSMYGDTSAPNPPDYGAAKAGVLQLARYQAVMWGPRNVRVNAITPGAFPNPAGVHGDAGFQERQRQRIPLARVGRSGEIAGAVVYLASPAASYVTGANLVVDGGWTAW